MKTLIFLFLFIKVSIGFCQENKILDSKIKSLYEKKEYETLITECTFELNERQLTVKDRIDLLYYRADCYMTLNNFREAISDWTELVELEPNQINYYNAFAYCYWSVSQLDSALMMVSKAYQINSSDILTLSNMAFYSSYAGEYEDAVRYATQGLKLESLKIEEKAKLLNNRGLGYIGLEQYQKALDDVNESIKIYSYNSYQFFYRALANIGLNRLETVCDDLEESKKLGGLNMTKEYIEVYCKK